MIYMVREANGGVKIVIDILQHGGAPGQVAALWDGDWCLGCGTITKTENSLVVNDPALESC